MTTLQKTTKEYLKLGTTGTQGSSAQRLAAKVGPVIWRLLTLSLAMGAGIALFHLLVLLIRASSGYAALLERGTDLYSIGMAIFMTIPTWKASQCGNGGRIARSNSC